MTGRYYVYRLFDSTGRLLYLGSSRNLLVRRTDHARSKCWWPLVDRWTLTGPFADKRAALDYETHAIRTETPRFNAQANAAQVITLAMRREESRLRDQRWRHVRAGRTA